MEKFIKIACKGATTIPYTDIIPFQGALKLLTEKNFNKLKKSILELGFSEPCSVWENKGKYYALNCHQRLNAIKVLVEDEGYVCPPLPCTLVDAENIKEAKKKILALTSSYGEITDDGLYEFMELNNIETDLLESMYNFHEIDCDRWLNGFEPEKTIDEKQKVFKLIVEVPTEQEQLDLYSVLSDKGYSCTIKS